MKFSKFVEYMKQLNSAECVKEKLILYLKDWHCQRHVSSLLLPVLRL